MTEPTKSSPRRALVGLRTVPVHSKVAEETHDILLRLARQSGKSVSDFIATLLELRCHGRAVVKRMEEASIEIVAGEYPDNIRDVAEK